MRNVLTRTLATLALAAPAAAFGSCPWIGNFAVVCPTNPLTGVTVPDGTPVFLSGTGNICFSGSSGFGCFPGTSFTPFSPSSPAPPVIGPPAPSPAIGSTNPNLVRGVIALTIPSGEQWERMRFFLAGGGFGSGTADKMQEYLQSSGGRMPPGGEYSQEWISARARWQADSLAALNSAVPRAQPSDSGAGAEAQPQTSGARQTGDADRLGDWLNPPGPNYPTMHDLPNIPGHKLPSEMQSGDMRTDTVVARDPLEPMEFDRQLPNWRSIAIPIAVEGGLHVATLGASPDNVCQDGKCVELTLPREILKIDLDFEFAGPSAEEFEVFFLMSEEQSIPRTATPPPLDLTSEGRKQRLDALREGHASRVRARKERGIIERLRREAEGETPDSVRRFAQLSPDHPEMIDLNNKIRSEIEALHAEERAAKRAAQALSPAQPRAAITQEDADAAAARVAAAAIVRNLASNDPARQADGKKILESASPEVKRLVGIDLSRAHISAGQITSDAANYFSYAAVSQREREIQEKERLREDKEGGIGGFFGGLFGVDLSNLSQPMTR